ncbi:MAG: phage portal protein [Hyalangium sp.]|uniref:phage portal protein n=1 Tax=Hyalangium sp. TaxID=2028555 RepID=UPI003899E766
MLAAFREHAYLQAVVSTVADAVATPRWHVYKPVDRGTEGRALAMALKSAAFEERAKLLKSAVQEGGFVEVRGHEVARILEAPHPKFSGRAYRKLLCIHLDLAGESFLWLSRDVTGRVNGFQVLPPQAVMTTPLEGQPYYSVSYNLFSGQVPASDIVWLRHLDPENPEGRGVGRGRAAGDELDSSEAIQKAIKASFERSGAPVATVGVEGVAGQDAEEAVEDLQKRYEESFGKPEQAGRVFFVPHGVSMAQLQIDLRALQMVEVDQSLREFCRQIYNVSPELMGDLTSSNRSTSEEAKYTLAEYCVVPRLEFLRAELQHHLVPLVDEDAILEYDDPRPQSWERKHKAMTSAYNEGVLVNEARELGGLPALAQFEGQVFKPLPGAVPVTWQPVSEPQNAPPPRGPAAE